MAKFHRNIFAVRSRLQLKYALLFLFSMAVPAMFVGVCMYYFIFVIVNEGLGVPESIGYNLFPVLRTVNLVMGLGLPLIFIVLLMTGLYMSNKLIGPIDRLKKELTQIAEGDTARRVRLRSDDELKFMADLINRILDRKG
ncbi:MAG: HAMP domain-containing protein [Candidatus Omnitrophota bacterium]